MLPLSICELFVRRCRFFDRLLRDNLVSSAELSWTNSSTKCSHHLVQYLCSICLCASIFGSLIIFSFTIWQRCLATASPAAATLRQSDIQKVSESFIYGHPAFLFCSQFPCVCTTIFQSPMCVCVCKGTHTCFTCKCLRLCVRASSLLMDDGHFCPLSFSVQQSSMRRWSAAMLLWTTEDEPSSSISSDGIIKKKRKSA